MQDVLYGKTYLNDGEAQYGRRDIADPHTRKHGDEHVSQQHGPRLRPGPAQDKGGHHLGNVVLGQGCSDGEATEQKHNDRRPHGREDIAGCLFRV